MKQMTLFENYKYCEICRRPLPLTYEDNLCPDCQEMQLFREVKEYIRQNDVTEYDVADHFKIPLFQVKGWIREGRIEYKEDPKVSAIKNIHCQKCGAAISFGTLCPKCLKQVNSSGHSSAPVYDSSHMRYLDAKSSHDHSGKKN